MTPSLFPVYSAGGDPFGNLSPTSFDMEGVLRDIQKAIPSVPNPVTGAIDLGKGAAEVVTNVLSSDFWQRVIFVILGVAFIVIALWMMGNQVKVNLPQ